MLVSVRQSMTSAGTTLSQEFTGGLATFLTLSYIFLLNPVLLAQTGMPIEAAFFGTVVAAALSTAIMGTYARVPFAIAPAPSITTFFVGYVCLELGLSWQTALAAVILSGVISILMAIAGAKAGLIRTMPEGLKYGVIFCLGGFLIGSGLRQAGITDYSESTFVDRLIQLNEFSSLIAVFMHPGTIVLAVGFFVTVFLNWRPINFRGSPIFGILVATGVATALGIVVVPPTESFRGMTAAVWAFDFSDILVPSALLSILVLFVIDFFGGVGKFVGLQKMLQREGLQVPQEKVDKALAVDGVGNMIGGAVGASSLAVFISSAVGIKAGARTGVASLFCALFMLMCLALIPVVGAIPTEATSGILVYIGMLLLPWNGIKQVFKKDCADDFNATDLLVGGVVAVLTFATFSIDLALTVLFAVYSLQSLFRKQFKEGVALYAVTILLSVAVIVQ